MSTKFYAKHRVTGEKWKPDPDSSYDHEYLIMYDTGYLAVVKEEFYTYIQPLDPKEWELIIKPNLLKKGNPPSSS
jgi:hypothetical protein